MNTCIYTKGERRKLGKVGNSIFFIPIFSSSPTASFDGIDIEPIKRITGKLFLPRITMLVGKTYRSKCRNAGRVRRALGDPLFFENARIERERERVSRERSRDVNVFREDVPWPRAAPNNKALKRLATTTPTRPYQISGKERNSSLDESSNPCDYPFFPQENVFRQPSTPKNSARFKRTFACMEIACVFS